MKKIAVIYWSGTGNTEAMAKAVGEGAASAGTLVELLPVDKASVESVTGADAIALGCPSMGSEVLEESEMEPFVAALEPVVTGKPVALFGSYGWGDGEWMKDWEERMVASGAKLVSEGLIIRETPDSQGLDNCRALGKQLV